MKERRTQNRRVNGRPRKNRSDDMIEDVDIDLIQARMLAHKRKAKDSDSLHHRNAIPLPRFIKLKAKQAPIIMSEDRFSNIFIRYHSKC